MDELHLVRFFPRHCLSTNPPISLDSVGIAGFSHDFKCLSGEKPSVLLAFDSLGTGKPLVSTFFIVLAPFFPSLFAFGLKRNQLVMNMRKTVDDVAEDLLSKTGQNDERGDTKANLMADRSILSQLCEYRIA